MKLGKAISLCCTWCSICASILATRGGSYSKISGATFSLIMACKHAAHASEKGVNAVEQARHYIPVSAMWHHFGLAPSHQQLCPSQWIRSHFPAVSKFRQDSDADVQVATFETVELSQPFYAGAASCRDFGQSMSRAIFRLCDVHDAKLEAPSIDVRPLKVALFLVC